MLTNKPTRLITPAEIDHYREQGVVKLANIFDLSWVDALREATEIALLNPGPHAEEYARGGGRFFGDLDLARRHSIFRNFVLHSPAAEIAGTIMESSKANFFYDQLLVKEPGTNESTPWHQDQPYWAVRGRQVASIWVPLDTVASESSLKYVMGSHCWQAHNPHHFIDNTPYEGTDLPELPDINANLEDYTIANWDMEPGDCLVFQAMIVHGSNGNPSSENRRRAYATRWTGDDARYDRRKGEVSIPTRDPGLTDGDPMTCKDFPLVWQRQSTGGAISGES